MTALDFVRALIETGKWHSGEPSYSAEYRMRIELSEAVTGHKINKTEKVFASQLRDSGLDYIFDEIEDPYEALRSAARKLHDPSNGVYVLGVHGNESSIDDIVGESQPYISIGKRIVYVFTHDPDAQDNPAADMPFGNVNQAGYRSVHVTIEPQLGGGYDVNAFCYANWNGNVKPANYKEHAKSAIFKRGEYPVVVEAGIPYVLYSAQQAMRQDGLGELVPYNEAMSYAGSFTGDNKPLTDDAEEILLITNLDGKFQLEELVYAIRGEKK